jgi:hypothetical protein
MIRPDERHSDEPPPFLGSWKRVYTAVLLYIVFVIAVLYAFTVVNEP